MESLRKSQVDPFHVFPGTQARTFRTVNGEGMMALKCGGSPNNPFLRLRLGQCLFELGDRQEAANWLAGAYLLEGKELFTDDDPKYLEFIKSQLEPPPGGWPEGW